MDSYGKGTWLQDEAFAYPNGGQNRRGAAICPDGKLRIVWAGIPDTFFTVPAHTRINHKYVAGYLSIVDPAGEAVLRFQPYGRVRW
jgi:hypothetical protein